MFQTIRNRVILIGFLVLSSVYALFPRTVRRTVTVDGVSTEVVTREVPLKYGLDLQGGMHLALEIDQSQGPVADIEDALDRAETVIRTRIDEFGVAEPLIQSVGTERLIVELPGISDRAQARDIVERSAFLEFQITDMQSLFQTALPGIDAALARAGVTMSAGEDAAQPAASAIQRLLGSATDSTDTAADTSVAQDDSTSVTAETPVVLSAHLFGGSIPGEFNVPEEDYIRVDSLIKMVAFQRAMPRGIELVWGVKALSLAGRLYRPLYALQENALITGEDLSDAQAQLDQSFGQAVVNFTLTRRGGRRFGAETARNVNNYMAVVLDGKVQGQPPIIRSQINRRGQIELGSASIQDAQDLALVLRAGALPAPLQIVEERTVGPSLGRDSIDAGKWAGMVGVVLVIVLMIWYYKLSGLFAVGALAFYGLFALGGLALIEATLTLPGMAGFILSLGLAVDANVLIFERIREELALNKSPRLAVDAGFQNAMPAIIDGNVTTVITAAFLFQFGTGPIKGFAVTLIIGIVASLLTAVFVTRTFFMVWLQRRSATAEISI